MMEQLGQVNSVLTFDEGIYCKAREIKMKRADEFESTVLRLGGFHIIKAFLAVIGKRFADSGLESILVESQVYGSNTAANLLRGVAYNRGIRAHKLTMEAMSRLRWRSFSEWLRTSDNDSLESATDLEATVHVCRNAFVKQDDAELTTAINELTHSLTDLQDQLEPYCSSAGSNSQTFAFWNEYISMVGILLDFIRAEREGDWTQHLTSVSEMLPLFFAFDRPNYSRWVAIYISDMHLLPETAPEVYQQFVSGNHVVARSVNKFCQVSTDMALEQSVNRDSKTKGGIIGLTKKTEALERWFMTAHVRSAVTTAVKDMCGINHGQAKQKESSPGRMLRDESDVTKIVNVVTFDMANPVYYKDIH
jgi:hypothetical protein